MAGIVRRLVEHRLSEQALHMTRTCPMPRPRSVASLAGAQMHGVQLTWHLPGQSLWPNGQRSGLFSNREADTEVDHALTLEAQTEATPQAASSTEATWTTPALVFGRRRPRTP